METICGATFVFDHEGEPDLIGNELTGGAYRVMVGRAPVSEGPPMHIHPHTDEGFYIRSPPRKRGRGLPPRMLLRVALPPAGSDASPREVGRHG